MTYATEVLADSPVAYYRLGEPSGTNANDSASGSLHDGTYTNAPTLGVAGAVDDGDTAVTFNGTDELVNCTTLGTLGGNLLTSSTEFWIKTTSTTTGKAILGTVTTGTANILQVLPNTTTGEAAQAGHTFFTHRGSNGQIMDARITDNIYDGGWHHVVWVVESSSAFSVYVDGTSRTVTVGNSTGPGGAGNFSHSMAIGARNSRGTIDKWFACTLDEVAFYATRLNSTRVAAHYAARVPSGPADDTLGPGRKSWF